MVSHTAVGQLALQHVVIVVVEVYPGLHDVHNVGHAGHVCEVHMDCVEQDVGTDGLLQSQHPEVM
jgi:hypothetical protein